ncbi:MAG: hypothetical protein ACRELA_20670 [Candidatus Rokuibacteriota bacterium]
MSDVVVAALIGATASFIGSVLTYLVGIRSVRRSVRTSNGAPLGPLLESRLDRVERRLDGMEHSIADVREWLAFREGRERPPLWTPRSLP